MNTDPQPIRKSSLPTTPPPEFEFSTVLGGEAGCMLLPGDTGPVVVRRRVTYGDWEPVRPDRWADEPMPETAAGGVVSAAPDQPDAPVCKFDEGCHRVVPCDPGCGATTPPADRAAVLLWAADQIDAETRQLKADGVLEPDKFRPCRDASEQLRRLAAEAQQPEPDGVATAEDRCADCGHFRGAHEEAEEPVSVGRCTVCADDDAWHNYEPTAEARRLAEAHACQNCEGIDPDTCLMDPERAPATGPRAADDKQDGA